MHAKRCFSNDKIVPIISNDGDISGTRLLINTFYTETKLIRIEYDLIQRRSKLKKVTLDKQTLQLLKEKDG